MRLGKFFAPFEKNFFHIFRTKLWMNPKGLTKQRMSRKVFPKQVTNLNCPISVDVYSRERNGNINAALKDPEKVGVMIETMCLELFRRRIH